jgi:hypothetical protein
MESGKGLAIQCESAPVKESWWLVLVADVCFMFYIGALIKKNIKGHSG